MSRLTPELEGVYAANTCKAYSQAVKRFDVFLDGRTADDETVAAFLEAEAERGLAPTTLAVMSAAIGASAESARADDPRGPLTSRTLRRLKRQHSDRGRGQVSGLRREDVEAAARLAAAEGTAIGLRDAALLRLGSDCLLRVSELAAVRVEEIATVADGSGCLRVPRSKTDQEANGENLYVCRATMTAIAAWRETAGVASGPLFRSILKDGAVATTALGRSGIRKMIRRRATAAGCRGRISGHSLRVGSAQSLVARGASTAELMQAGRWKDPKTATSYAANELAAGGAVARFFEAPDE